MVFMILNLLALFILAIYQFCRIKKLEKEILMCFKIAHNKPLSIRERKYLKVLRGNKKCK